MSYGPKWKSKGSPVLTKSVSGGVVAEKVTMTTTDPSRLKEIDAIAEQGGMDFLKEIGAVMPAQLPLSIDGRPPTEEETQAAIDSAAKEQRRKFAQSVVVTNYRRCLEAMHEGSSKDHGWGFIFGGKMDDTKVRRGYAKRVWTLLRSARLVAIPSRLYVESHEQWDRRLTDELGYTWVPPAMGINTPDEEVWATCEHTAKRARELPYPERLPFEVTYFGYGAEGNNGPFIPPEQLAYRTDIATARRVRQVHLLSTLISTTGYCVDFFGGWDTQSQCSVVFMACQHDPDEAHWIGYSAELAASQARARSLNQFKIDLSPFIVCDLVEHVNGFVDLRDPDGYSKEEKKDWRHRRKKTGVEKGEPPPHYYPYRLRSESHSEEGGSARERRDLSYRTDVRAHERLLVRRGELPIPPKKHEYYIANDFTVYQEEALPWHLKARLAAKGHSGKQTYEWMAVKRVWIKHHMNSNDESLPYRQKLTIA
jgi:hypothetical protein